jgi:hypothetical protein
VPDPGDEQSRPLSGIQFSNWLVYLQALPMACLILVLSSPTSLSSIQFSNWLVYLQALPKECLILVMSSTAPSQVSTSLIGWLPAGPANGAPDPGDEQSHPLLPYPVL